MSTVEISKILNLVQFKVDNASYKRALMAIRKVGAEWAKVQGKMSSAMSAGRRIAGTSGRGGGGSRSQFVGPMPFSPGTNTKVQQREAKRAVQEQARIARQTETATKKHNDTLRKLREIDARRQESEAKRQEQFKNKIAGQFMGPMPSRDIVNARRESIRNQRNEANRSARAQETITAGNIRRTSMFGGAGNAAMGSQIASLNAQLKSGAISLQVYRQSVAALERDFKRASAGGRDFLGTLREVRSAFIALTAANLAFTGGAAVMRTGQMFEGINAAMSMTSDSTSETASKIQFIRDEAYRLGLDLKTAAQGFVQMSVASKEIMSSGQTQELFTGLSEYSTALGLDQFRFEKALLGFTQIANKGQLMSEEVKNQIGEQLPGALDLFRKAASEFSGKELTTPEFFKMMEKGELLAQDILPLMGKMMSEAAKKGGALEKMLNSNGVAMRRLQQTWTNFQNVIFMSGFGEALTRTFNSLAFALKNNEGAAKSIGVVLGGLVDGFMYFGGTVHDVSLLTYHYINKYIVDPLTQLVPALKEIEGSWVAQAAGVLIAASAFAKLSGFLWSIVKALKMIPKLLPAATAVGGAAAATGGTGAAVAGAARFGATPIAMGAAQGYVFHNFVQDYFVPWQKSIVDSIFGAPTMRTDMRPSLQSSVSGIRVPTLAPMAAPSPLMNQQPQNINIKVVPDGTKFADAVKVEVDAGTSNFGNTLINLMTD